MMNGLFQNIDYLILTGYEIAPQLSVIKMDTPHPEKYGIPILVNAILPISELNNDPIEEKNKIRPCQTPAKKYIHVQLYR